MKWYLAKFKQKIGRDTFYHYYRFDSNNDRKQFIASMNRSYPGKAVAKKMSGLSEEKMQEIFDARKWMKYSVPSDCKFKGITEVGIEKADLREG